VSWKEWKNILVQSINLTRVIKSHFQCAKVRKKSLFYSYWINIPILCVHHTQCNHDFLLWKSHLKFWDKSSSYTFTPYLDIVHYHAENNFSDKLRNCCTLNARTINRVLMSKEKECKAFCIFYTIQIKKPLHWHCFICQISNCIKIIKGHPWTW